MTASTTAVPSFLEGGGEMGARIRAFDWPAHPLGPPAAWPPALQTAVSLCLSSTFPTSVYWGQQSWLLYNDAWAPVPADKHPWALGRPAREVWPDIWHVIEPQFACVLATGEGQALYEQMLPMKRGGQVRETWWNYSLTAIRLADHTIGGIFNQGHEITQLVNSRRERLAEIDRWRDLFRQAPASVALLRGPEHVFEFANDAYLVLVGNREVLGRPVREVLPEIEEQGFVAMLDRVYRSGEPHVARGAEVMLQRTPGAPAEQRVLDFICQPVRDAGGEADGIFVLVTDVTDRSRAEAQLRITNWQLGEERARLAATVEAEQRAQNALRRFTETLEGQVRTRTGELSRALEAQSAVADRLRATFQTELIYQGFLDPSGILLDANKVSLAAIGAQLHEVVGKPFWETPWFAATPGAGDVVRAAVGRAAAGELVRQSLELQFPGGPRRFSFNIRPAFNARGELAGLVPEAVDVTDAPGLP